jgi:uncharacterized membrane protein YfcA
MTAHELILTLISGGIVGFSLGLLGGGGSILAVPLLAYFVGVKNVHEVIGTSALAVALNAYFNLIPHWRAGHVRWLPAVLFGLPGMAGAVVGSDFGKIVNGHDLLFLFALLMIVVAGMMVQRERGGPKKALAASSQVPAAPAPRPRAIRPAYVMGTGFLVGALSGFFGIGGGFLIVPGLVFSTGMTFIQAVGSSLFSVGTFGLTTAANYALSGWVNPALAGGFIAGGIFGGIGGTLMASRLSRQKALLSDIFSAVVFLMALYMIYRSLGL